MKALPSISFQPVLNEIIASWNRINPVLVPIESETRLRPVEIRRFVRNLRQNRSRDIS